MFSRAECELLQTISTYGCLGDTGPAMRDGLKGGSMRATGARARRLLAVLATLGCLLGGWGMPQSGTAAEVAGQVNGIVVYQTDFGLKDGAVSAMHGVALSVDPDLR